MIRAARDSVVPSPSLGFERALAVLLGLTLAACDKGGPKAAPEPPASAAKTGMTADASATTVQAVEVPPAATADAQPVAKSDEKNAPSAAKPAAAAAKPSAKPKGSEGSCAPGGCAPGMCGGAKH